MDLWIGFRSLLKVSATAFIPILWYNMVYKLSTSKDISDAFGLVLIFCNLTRSVFDVWRVLSGIQHSMKFTSTLRLAMVLILDETFSVRPPCPHLAGYNLMYNFWLALSATQIRKCIAIEQICIATENTRLSFLMKSLFSYWTAETYLPTFRYGKWVGWGKTERIWTRKIGRYNTAMLFP